MNSKWVSALVVGVMVGICTSASAAIEKTSTDKSTTVATSSALTNINTADLATLETIKGLGATKAQAIIDYRTKNGKFATLQDLQNVPGIGPKLIEKIQSQITA